MTDDQDVRVRKYGEVVFNTLTSVASALEYPKGLLIHTDIHAHTDSVCLFKINFSSSFQITVLMILFFSFFLHNRETDLIKDSARPSYWVPDVEAPTCSICAKLFGTAEQLMSAQRSQVTAAFKSSQHDVNGESSPMKIVNTKSRSPVRDRRRHHCRGCGQAVCDECSQGRRPVPERGWTTDVRVCDSCNKNKYKND